MKLIKICNTLAAVLIASFALAACNNNSFNSGNSSGGGGSSSGSSSSSSGGSSSSSSGGSSSSSSSSGGSSSSSSGGSSSAAVLPYFDAGSGGSIKLVDPSNPSATPVVADSGFGVTDAVTGTIDTKVITTYDFDAGTGAQTNLQHALVVYAKNGKLYKISLASGDSHTPQQFSSLSSVCALVNEFDDGTLGDTYLVVQSLNAQSQCAQNTVLGDTLSLVKVSAGTADAGIAQNGRAIEGRIIGSAGTLTGFLVKETSGATVTLRSEDTTLANPVDLLTLTSGSFVDDPVGSAFISGIGELDYFTAQASGASNRALYRYSPASNSAPKIQDLASQSGGFGSADASAYYYADGGTLNKVAHSSTTPSVLLTRTLGTGESLAIPGLSPTRLVFTDTGSSKATLESMLKDGSGAVTIDSATFTAPNTTSFDVLPGVSERLFYTHSDTIISGASFSQTDSAHQVMTDGSGAITTASNALWSGFAINNSTSVGKVLLSETTATTVHLFAYDAASGAQVTDIGTALNVQSPNFLFEFGAFSDKNLLSYTPTGRNDNDTYFYDAGTDNSLLGVATQPDINETAIIF